MHFLELPREIRDIVYDKLLVVERPAPDFDGRDDDKIQNLAVRDSREIEETEPHPKLEPVNNGHLTPTITCLPLMRSCRQLNNEVRERLRVRADTTAVLLLSLGAEGQKDMSMTYVQWYSIPAPFQYVKHVEVRLRITSERWVVQTWDHNIKFMGDGGPGRIIQFWLQLLSNFLLHGPGFEHRRRLYDLQLPLESLTLVYVWPKGLKYECNTATLLIGRDKGKQIDKDCRRDTLLYIGMWDAYRQRSSKRKNPKASSRGACVRSLR